MEETTAAQGKAIGFLLQREAELVERCEDLQNRVRRQNLRLYQVPEASEGSDIVAFIKKLLLKVLRLICRLLKMTSELSERSSYAEAERQ